LPLSHLPSFPTRRSSDLFTTNGRPYNSTAAPCGVTVSPTLGTPNGGVWINTTTPTQYGVKQAPPFIANGAKNYFVNLTMVPDTKDRKSTRLNSSHVSISY